MVLSRVKKCWLTGFAVLTVAGSVSVSVMGCGPEPSYGCCDDYVPETLALQATREPEIYLSMCSSSMGFDDKYDLGNECKFKEVDRYLDAAVKCCAPLVEKNVSKGILDFSVRHDAIPYTGLSLFLPVWTANAAKNQIWLNMPTNAYTWCLMNTNPRTYQCNISKAREFEDTIVSCCSSVLNTSCIWDLARNGGACMSSIMDCCSDLPENSDGVYVSMTYCNEIQNITGACVRTVEDACCYALPENTDSYWTVTKSACRVIFETTSGESCINDDEKYYNYLNNQ